MAKDGLSLILCAGLIVGLATRGAAQQTEDIACRAIADGGGLEIVVRRGIAWFEAGFLELLRDVVGGFVESSGWRGAAF